MVTRRRVLKALPGVLVATAGCGSRDAGSGGPTPTTSDPASPTRDPTRATTDPTTAVPVRSDSPGDESVTTTAGGCESSASTTAEPTTTVRVTPSSAGVVWEHDTGADGAFASAIGDGRVYAGSGESVVRAHVIEDGSEQWTAELSDPIQAIDYAEGTVLVISGTVELRGDQDLHAIDAADGTERWTADLTDWYLSVLGTRDGTVYVGTADDYLQGYGQTLYALSLADGSTEWSTEIGDPSDHHLTDGTIYVGSYGWVYAIDATTGDERWSNEIEEYTFRTLATLGSTAIYADKRPEGTVLIGVDRETGERRFTFDRWRVSSVVAGDDAFYVGGGATGSLAPAGGSVNWRATPGTHLLPVLDGERVYVASNQDARVIAYPRDGGCPDWEWTPTPDRALITNLSIRDDVLYAAARGEDGGSNGRYRFALDAATGTTRWVFEDDAELSELVVGGDLAVTGGANGTLYGLR